MLIDFEGKMINTDLVECVYQVAKHSMEGDTYTFKFMMSSGAWHTVKGTKGHLENIRRALITTVNLHSKRVASKEA